MKTTLFSLVLLLSGTLSAQNFSLESTDTLFYGEVSASEFGSKFIIQNDSTGPVPLSWEVESEDLQSGWEYSLCDPDVCHSVGTTSGSFNLATGSFIKYMNIHYYPNGFYGQSTVTVKLWEDAYPDDFIILTWVGVVSALSVESQDACSVEAFYNASKATIQFNYDLPSNNGHVLNLYDISGKLVTSQEINNSAGTLEIASILHSGIYFYTINQGRTKVLSSKIIVP
ncbi:MAG: T9SS type A sorting domain-containing protein [Crocinitomicaceae bacterium]|nr:T9SS type A sorting domain-containing protein [Crocinitomicaceae bacterium]